MGRRSRRSHRLAVLLLAFIGADLVLLSTTKYGSGLSPDSVAYFDVARSLVSGKGFVSHTGEPLVYWPPLYPTLLACIGFVARLDPSAFARLIGAALFGFVIYLSSRLIENDLRQAGVCSLLGTCAIVFSKPLSEVYSMAWSETLFIPLVLIYLLFAQRYWSNGRVRFLVAMTVSAALACVTRYIGVALIPAGIATVILASGTRFRTRLRRALAFAALSLPPFALWALRNHQITGTFTGARDPFGPPSLHQVALSVDVALSWYTFGLASALGAIAWFLVLIVAAASPRNLMKRAASSLRSVFVPQLPLLLFVAAYVVALFVSSVTTADRSIGDRLLSPVFVPVTLILLKLGSHLLGPRQPAANFLSGRAPVVLLAIWLCLPILNVVSTTADRIKNGAGGYNTRACRESPTIAFARQVLPLPREVRVYSNGPDVLWELANLDATGLPGRTGVSLNDLKGRWPDKSGSAVVWFRSLVWRTYFFSIPELSEVAVLTEIARFRDGSFLLASPRRVPSPDSSR